MNTYIQYSAKNSDIILIHTINTTTDLFQKQERIRTDIYSTLYVRMYHDT